MRIVRDDEGAGNDARRSRARERREFTSRRDGHRSTAAQRPRARGRTGIDTGGTFTDFVVRRGRDVVVHKVLSTPHDPARAVLHGLAELFPDGASGRITYGSTVA